MCSTRLFFKFLRLIPVLRYTEWFAVDTVLVCCWWLVKAVAGPPMLRRITDYRLTATVCCLTWIFCVKWNMSMRDYCKCEEKWTFFNEISKRTWCGRKYGKWSFGKKLQFPFTFRPFDLSLKNSKDRTWLDRTERKTQCVRLTLWLSSVSWLGEYWIFEAFQGWESDYHFSFALTQPVFLVCIMLPFSEHQKYCQFPGDWKVVRRPPDQSGSSMAFHTTHRGLSRSFSIG